MKIFGLFFWLMVMPFLVLGQKRDSLLERAQNFYDWEADGYKINQCLDENRKEIPGLKYIYSREHGSGLLKNNSILLPPIFKYGTIISKRYYVINRPNGGVYDIEKEEWCILPIQSRVEYLSHHNFLVHHQNSIWKIVNAADKKTVGHYNLEYDSKHACILGSPKQSMTTHDGNKDNFILKYGIYDKKTGEISVPLEYDELRSLEEFGIDSNIFIARKGAVYTLINKHGNTLLGPFDEVEVEREKIMTRKGKKIVGFDLSLRVIFTATSSNESLISRAIYNSSTQEFTYTTKNIRFNVVSEIIHSVWLTKKGNKYGIIRIDEDGDIRVLVKAEYDSIFKAENYLMTSKNGKYGLLKHQRSRDDNRYVGYPVFLDCVYDYIEISPQFSMRDGRYPMIVKKNSAFYAILNPDRTAEPKDDDIIKIKGDSVSQIISGIVISKERNKYYLQSIGMKNNFKTEPFLNLKLVDRKFSNNVAKNMYNDKYNYEHQFFKVTKANGLVGIINTSGDIVAPTEFEDVLYVETSGTEGVQNHRGYTQSRNLYSAVVLKDSKCGLFDLKTRQFIIPCQYDQIVSSGSEQLYRYSNSNSYLVFKNDICYFYQRVHSTDQSTKILISGTHIDSLQSTIRFSSAELTTSTHFNGFDIVKTRNNKVGLLQNSRAVLPPIFQNIRPVDSVHYTVKINDYVGVFNAKTKKIVVPVQYDDLSFLRKNAYKASRNGKTGIIDHNNSIIIDFQYGEVQKIDDQQLDIGGSNLNDIYRVGSIIYDIKQKKQVFPTTEGYSSIQLAKDGGQKIYIITKNKRQNISFSNKKPILNNWVESIYYDKKSKIFCLGEKGCSGYADTTGKILLEPLYRKISDFYWFDLLHKDGKYFLAYKNNGQLKVQEYDNGFGPDFVYFLLKKGNKYAIQRSSENEPQQLIYLNYDFLELFGDRQFKVKLNKKFGLVDTDNKVIVPLIYDSIYTVLVGGAPFTIAKTPNQLAVYGKDSLYFIVEGNEIEYLNEFNNRSFYYDTKFEDLFKFKTHEGWGIINSKGEVFIKPEFADIVFQKHNLAVVKQNGKYGLFSLVENKLVLPCAYKHIYPLEASLKSEHHFLLEKNGDYFATGYKIDKPLELTKFYDTVK